MSQIFHFSVLVSQMQNWSVEWSWVLIHLTCIPFGPCGPWGPLAPCIPWNTTKYINSTGWTELMNGWQDRERLLYLWPRWTVGPWNSNITRKPLAKTRGEGHYYYLLLHLLLQYMISLFCLSWGTWLIGWAWSHILTQLIEPLCTLQEG